MGSERRFHGATSSSAIIGAAFYWAWVDTFLFTPTMSTLFGAPGRFFVVAFITAVSTGCVILFLAAHRPETFRSFLHAKLTMVMGGTAAIIGGLVTLSGSYISSTPLIIVGGIIDGAVFGFGLIAWGEICATGGARTASVHIPAAFALGVALDWVLMMLDPLLGTCIMFVFPLVSFLILHVIRKHPEDFEEPGRRFGLPNKTSIGQPTSEGTGSLRTTWFGLNRTVVTSFVVFGVAFGYMQYQSVFEPASTFQSQLLLVVRGSTALIFFLGTVFLKWRPHITYRVGMALMIAGFMILPFASQASGFAGLSESIVMAGYTCFDIMVWTILAELAYCSSIAPESTIGSGRGLLHLGIVTGMGIGICLSLMPLSGITMAVVTTSVGYLLVIAVILIISDQYGLWSLLKYGSMYIDESEEGADRLSPGEKAAMLAARYNLTVREREVLSLLLAGRSARYIAEQIYVSENTVNSHVRHIYEKLDIHNRQELLDRAETI